MRNIVHAVWGRLVGSELRQCCPVILQREKRWQRKQDVKGQSKLINHIAFFVRAGMYLLIPVLHSSSQREVVTAPNIRVDLRKRNTGTAGGWAER